MRAPSGQSLLTQRVDAALRRLLDVVVAVFALAVVVLPLAIACLLIVFESSGSPVFCQMRIGYRQKPFRIVKLRTMVTTQSQESPLVTASGDSRVTRIGRVLRRWKIDEIPQLINVLVGQMSLVGPRPEIPRFFDTYSPQMKAAITAARPGLTDPASIRFRDEESLLVQVDDPERFYVHTVLPIKLALSADYLRRRTIASDLAVLTRTLSAIMGRVVVNREQRRDG